MNKKAQVYPIAIALILFATLSFAFFALKGSKAICSSGTGGSCTPLQIGAKPNQIFYTLQDADAIQFYVDQAAKIAVEKSMDDLKYSCAYEETFESSSIIDTSPCGVHIYPLWSTAENMCLPDCKYSFEGLFNKELSYELSKYYFLTGITLPTEYAIDVNTENGGTFISGISKNQLKINSYPLAERLLLEEDPAAISSTETAIREAKTEKTPPSNQEPGTEEQPSQKGTLSWPVAGQKQINSCFGPRMVSGGSNNHPGIDIQSGQSNVLAPAPGIVEDAGNPSDSDNLRTGKNGRPVDSSSCWGTVVINHGDGIKTVFLHMERISVTRGQKVNRGDLLGTSGGRGFKNGVCSPDAYPNHIHMEVLYNGIPSGISNEVYIRDGKKADLVRSTSRGFAINPLCVLDLSGATVGSNKNCMDPINTDLAVICPKYGLNNNIQMAYSSSPTFDSSITAAAVLKSKTIAATPSPTQTGTYSFTPAFTVKVNKNLEDPLKEVTTWAESTWNTCTDDLKKCLDAKIAEHNAKTDKIFTLKTASECEEKPVDFFLDFMEAWEDALSNGQAGCFIDFDASAYSFSGKIIITLDGKTATLAIAEPGKEPKQVEGVSYTLFSGDFDSDAVPYKEFTFSFKDDYSLDNVKVTGYSLSPTGEKVETAISDGPKTARAVKLLGKDGTTNLGEFISVDNEAFPACLPRKEKYRLCAVPNPAYTSLFTVKFAMQFKDEPPKKECKSAEITVIPEQKKVDSYVEDIAKIKGFDVLDLFSAIPIPALQFAGAYIGISDIVANLPAQEGARLRITVKSSDPDVVGYNVYCSDLPEEVKDILKDKSASILSSPQSVAVIEQKARELEVKTTGLDAYTKTSQYTKFLDKEDCRVPTIDPAGIVRKVPGTKATTEGDITSFTVAQCSGASVAIDKILKKEYCITLVPFDKQGRENQECAITNCGKTNSLLDLAITKFLETKLKNAMVIPPDALPKEFAPYFRLPDQDDFIDAALGKRSMDFSDMVDLEGAQNALAQGAQNFILKELNNDVVGAAFLDTFNSLDESKQRAVLSAVSQEINSPTAKLIVTQFIEGKNIDSIAQQAVLSKATDYLTDEQAREVLTEFLRSGDIQTSAFTTLQRQAEKSFTEMAAEQKRQTLERAANSREGQRVKQKIQDVAAQTSCSASQIASMPSALSCMSDRQLNLVYDQLSKEREAGRTILSSQLEHIENDKARAAVAQLAQTRDFEGTARAALDRQIESMDESKKLDLVQEALRSGTIPDRAIQAEVMKLLPNTDMDAVNRLLQNGNIQSLLDAKLKESITRQLDSFITQQCVERKKI